MAKRRYNGQFVAQYLARRAAASLPGGDGSRPSAQHPASGIPSGRSAGCVVPVPTEGAPLRILGIDTSLRSTGLAILETDGRTQRVLDLRPIPNPAKRPLGECLCVIRETLSAYLRQWTPHEAAMEGIFFMRNARTSLILAHARGVVIETCAEAGLTPVEYPPSRVKKALTGGGAATKANMRAMIQRLFSLPELPQEDAADALAIALTHLHARRLAAFQR